MESKLNLVIAELRKTFYGTVDLSAEGIEDLYKHLVNQADAADAAILNVSDQEIATFKAELEALGDVVLAQQKRINRIMEGFEQIARAGGRAERSRQVYAGMLKDAESISQNIKYLVEGCKDGSLSKMHAMHLLSQLEYGALHAGSLEKCRECLDNLIQVRVAIAVREEHVKYKIEDHRAHV